MICVNIKFIILLIILFIIYTYVDNIKINNDFVKNIQTVYNNKNSVCLSYYSKPENNSVEKYMELINIINTNDHCKNMYKRGKISIKLHHFGNTINEKRKNIEKVINYAKKHNVFVWISSMLKKNQQEELETYMYFKNKEYNNIGLTVSCSFKNVSETIDNLLKMNSNIRLVKGQYKGNVKNWKEVSNLFLRNSKKLVNSNNFHSICTHDIFILKQLNLQANHIEYGFLYEVKDLIERKLKNNDLKIKNISFYLSKGNSFNYIYHYFFYLNLNRIMIQKIQTFFYLLFNK